MHITVWFSGFSIKMLTSFLSTFVERIHWVARRCYSPQQSSNEDRIGLAVADLTESAKSLVATQQSLKRLCNQKTWLL